MISVQNVHFSYGTKPVLQGISFDVADGESVAIMGPSGSGKSTILRLILGLECPQQGMIFVGDQDICRLRESQKREHRKKIGMVFQDGALFDSMTVGENVGYFLIEHSKLLWEDVDQRVREMLGFVELDCDEVIDRLPEELSGGMQRRVAIGRALLSTDPKIMLYDEPTTGLDPHSTNNVLKLIEKLQHEREVATIMVTHQIADAFSIADRYLVIVEGHLVFDGDLDSLRDSDNEQVNKFLSPFRASISSVLDKKFAGPRPNLLGVDENENNTAKE